MYTNNTIQIEVTVGELSRALKSDERFGLYIQGGTAAGELRDEPECDDEPVLTVRLTVDATLEPVWKLVCNSNIENASSNSGTGALHSLDTRCSRVVTDIEMSFLGKLSNNLDSLRSILVHFPQHYGVRFEQICFEAGMLKCWVDAESAYVWEEFRSNEIC